MLEIEFYNLALFGSLNSCFGSLIMDTDTQTSSVYRPSEESGMYLANLNALSKIIRKNSRLVSVAAKNISHRFGHNILNHQSYRWSHSPETVTVMVTDKCNLRCRQCHYAYTESSGFHLNQVGGMDTHIFRKLMDEIPARLVISFTGGEPLLHPEVVDFVSYAKRKKGFVHSRRMAGF